MKEDKTGLWFLSLCFFVAAVVVHVRVFIIIGTRLPWANIRLAVDAE